MNKYDKMLDVNQKRNQEKEDRARIAIHQLLDEGKRVSVTRLVETTGLSKGYFYKNERIRDEITKAMDRQRGMPDPRRSIFGRASNERTEIVMKKLAELQKENFTLKEEVEKLRTENAKLQNSLNRKTINRLKSL